MLPPKELKHVNETKGDVARLLLSSFLTLSNLVGCYLKAVSVTTNESANFNSSQCLPLPPWCLSAYRLGVCKPGSQCQLNVLTQAVRTRIWWKSMDSKTGTNTRRFSGTVTLPGEDGCKCYPTAKTGTLFARPRLFGAIVRVEQDKQWPALCHAYIARAIDLDWFAPCSQFHVKRTLSLSRCLAAFTPRGRSFCSIHCQSRIESTNLQGVQMHLRLNLISF